MVTVPTSGGVPGHLCRAEGNLLVGIIVGIPYVAYVRKAAHWHHEAEGHHANA